MSKIQIISDKNIKSLKIKSLLKKEFYKSEVKRINTYYRRIGGDGFMLQTLKKKKIKKIILWSEFWKLWFFNEQIFIQKILLKTYLRQN
jgi:NAD+ kinase